MSHGLTGLGRKRAGRAALIVAMGALPVAAVPALVDRAGAPETVSEASFVSRERPTPEPAVAATAGEPRASVAESPGPEVEELRRELDRLLARAPWRRVRWGVWAVSLDRGDTLFTKNAHEPMAPASNVKIITTAAALHHLGPDFRYRTWVLADGPVRDGVVEGDLVLYGTGDPTFSDQFLRSELTAFEQLAAQLKEAGIRAVAGDLVGDGSYFHGPDIEATWDPRDLNEWFAAPVSALSFNENMISLRIEPAAWVGAPPRIQTLPEGAGVLVENQARTVAAPPERYARVGVVRQSHAEPIRVLGDIQLGTPEIWREMTVSNPPLYAATMFRRVLEAEGIEVYGRTRAVGPGDDSVLGSRSIWGPGFDPAQPPRIVAELESPPLTQMLEVLNNQSHNLYAETVLRSVGAAAIGDASFEGGAQAATEFLTGPVGARSEELTLVDGSGLSAENQVSAAVFVRLLRFMAESDSWEPFWDALPEAGNRRELPRMYRSPAAGNLRAKTGTIERVSALSGVVHAQSGERIAFSILANDVPSAWGAKTLEDRIGVRLAEFTRPGPTSTPSASPLP